METIGRNVGTVCLILDDLRTLVGGTLRRGLGTQIAHFVVGLIRPSAKADMRRPFLLRVGIESVGGCGQRNAWNWSPLLARVEDDGRAN